MPQPGASYAARDLDQALLRRCVTPPDPEQIKWLVRQSASFYLPDGLFETSPWSVEGDTFDLEEESYKRQKQRFAIYTAHRMICEEINDLRQRQSANALLTLIVWFKQSRRAEDSIVKSHIYPIRSVLIYLGQQGYLLDIDKPPNFEEWLAEVAQGLADEEVDDYFMKLFQKVAKFFRNRLELGHRRKKKVSINRTQKSVRLNNSIWNIEEDGHGRINTEVFHTPSTNSGTGKLAPKPQTSEDDGKPTDAIELSNTTRTGRDAKFHARRINTSSMLGGIQGYDHKETYTPCVAGYLLSCLDPNTAEGRLAAQTIIMGRLNKHWDQVKALGNTITVTSVQNSGREIVLTLPLGLAGEGENEVGRALATRGRIYAKFKAWLKKEGHMLGTRVSMGGLARFGVMRFHGEIGIVQSEQLQGSLSKGGVTAIYGALETVDFQRALDKIIVGFSAWLLEEANYVGSAWKAWAREIKLAMPAIPYVPENVLYGSNKVWGLTDSMTRAVNRQLKDHYECVVDVSVRDARREHLVEYINVCAKALNLSYMAITGARPLTNITRVALGEDFVVIADKRHYGTRAARVLRMPSQWLGATRCHLSNCQALVDHLACQGMHSDDDLHELRHPFVTIEMRKKSEYRVEHLTQQAMSNWVGSITDLGDLPANGLRHAKVTEMLKSNVPDGVVANVLGHERGLVDGTGPYLGSMSLVETPIGGLPWVPLIKSVYVK